VRNSEDFTIQVQRQEVNSRNFQMVLVAVIDSGLSSWHLPDGICRPPDNGDF